MVDLDLKPIILFETIVLFLQYYIFIYRQIVKHFF